MDKRYQVFVSSTFSDLREERQGVIRAILELDHMPAGMELFPAADDTAWQLIRDVIDGSDYYLLIVGGRYGSLDERGIGYTEKEYDYALETNKPVIALLHQKPEGLPREKTETDDLAWKKLMAFREKIEKRHTCVYWTTGEDLRAKVILGLTAAIKRRPAAGWIRADQVPTDATLAQVLALRTRIAELENERDSDAARPPKGTEELLQGDETLRVDFVFTARDPNDVYPYPGDLTFEAWFSPTWDDIFAHVAPIMINEAADSEVKASVQRFFLSAGKKVFEGRKDLKKKDFVDFKFDTHLIETVIIQFRALGLIEQSVRARSVKDVRTYWRLTKYGDNLMTKLRAIRRSPPPEPDAGIASGEE